MAPANNIINTSISTPLDYYKYLVVVDHSNLLEAWEDYEKKKSLGYQTHNNIVRARTKTLFFRLSAHLKRKLNAKYEEWKAKLVKEHITDAELEEIFLLITEKLDEDYIIRMDTRQTYDGTIVEEENEAKDE